MTDQKPIGAWIHPSMGLESLNNRRLSVFQSGDVPPLFLYESAIQSQRWLDVHRAHSPAANLEEVQSLYQKAAVAAADAIRPINNNVSVIALGCGGSSKDLMLLDALAAKKINASFYPVDVSASLSVLSADAGKSKTTIPPTAIVADLLEFKNLSSWLDEIQAHSPRIYTAYGILPNLDSNALLALCHSWLHSGDVILFSANLSPGGDANESGYVEGMKQIFDQYNNAETRAWLTEFLRAWGLADCYGDVEFQIKNKDQLYQIEGATKLKNEVSFCWNGKPLSLPKKLKLFYSVRHTPKRILDLLTKHGLISVKNWIAPNEQEGVWLVGLKKQS